MKEDKGEKNGRLRIFLIGCGPGGVKELSTEAVRIIKGSEIVLGTGRLLLQAKALLSEEGYEELSAGSAAENDPVNVRMADKAGGKITGLVMVRTYTDEALRLIDEAQESLCRKGGEAVISVLYGGDSTFFSGALKLNELIREKEREVKLIPGCSSVQYFAARLNEGWQDWKLVSAHGKRVNIYAELKDGRPVFLLTNGIQSAADICRELALKEYLDCTVAAGINLSYPDELVIKDSAERVSKAIDSYKEKRGLGGDGLHTGPDLAVLLICPGKAFHRGIPGIPDEEFIRGGRPMTKRSIRALIISGMNPGREDTVLDIGAGTGSVSIELSMFAGRVYAIEREEEGIQLIEKNRERFCAWNLDIIKGEAPEALYEAHFEGRVSKIFIGGSGGRLAGLIRYLNGSFPEALICFTAVMPETLGEGLSVLKELSYETEAELVSVSRSVNVNEGHMMKAENPVFIVTAKPPRRIGTYTAGA